MSPLVGVKEVAEMLGVTPARVSQIVREPDKKFPKSEGEPGDRPVWRRRKIERWAEVHRPTTNEGDGDE